MTISMNRGLRWVAPAALSLALVAGACGGDDDESSAGDEPAATVDAGAAGDQGDAGGGGETVALELEAQDFEFAPATLTAPAGAEVTLTLRNTGDAPHTFTAGAVGVDEEVGAGESADVTFTMPDSGTLEFVCTFHEAQGMTGTIDVG